MIVAGGFEATGPPAGAAAAATDSVSGSPRAVGAMITDMATHTSNTPARRKTRAFPLTGNNVCAVTFEPGNLLADPAELLRVRN
ncbi:hypothetical protein ATCCBAA256_17150 [Mycobacterium montefiorense]|nr:hypothetical protein ATCCBAA256_17150 [Mycobacterium montefiorense]